MKGFGAVLLAVTSAAVGAAAAMYAMRKREELEKYDYDFDEDDEIYFEDCDCEECSVSPDENNASDKPDADDVIEEI